VTTSVVPIRTPSGRVIARLGAAVEIAHLAEDQPHPARVVEACAGAGIDHRAERTADHDVAHHARVHARKSLAVGRQQAGLGALDHEVGARAPNRKTVARAHGRVIAVVGHHALGADDRLSLGREGLDLHALRGAVRDRCAPGQNRQNTRADAQAPKSPSSSSHQRPLFL
jgi:hypothetical protein